MDCENARILMLFYRPGRTADLSADDVAALEAHLAGCPACAARASRQAAADVAVGGAMAGVPIPGGLRSALVETTSATAAAAGRRAFLRRTVGAAAALTAGLVGFGGYQRATRATPDLDAVVYAVEADLEDPDRTARDWLTVEGLPLPENFDLRHVVHHGDVGLHGVRGRGLILQASGRRAWVIFVRPTDTAVAAANAQASTATARVYRDLPGGWTAVVVYTGHDLTPFLRTDGLS